MTHRAAFHQPENISSAAFHFSRYRATEHNDTGCLATGYHAAGNHASIYHDTATENRLGRVLGGVAYDHGDFPKIVSVHSMAESHQESSTSEATDCHDNPQTEAKNACEDVTDAQNSTDHSISTILDQSSSNPVLNSGSVKPLSEVFSLGNNAKISLDSDETELGTKCEYISTEDENGKVSC